LALRVGVEVDAAATFLFFFSATDCEWSCITAIGFRDRGPLNSGARGGFPTVEDLPVALVVATAGRTAPVFPNRFRGIGGVAGVESGSDASAENSSGHAGMKSGAISAGGGENGGAGDDGQRIWAGGAAARRELDFLGATWAVRKYERGRQHFRDHSLIFDPLAFLGFG
jgi:hypothetical protein